MRFEMRKQVQYWITRFPLGCRILCLLVLMLGFNGESFGRQIANPYVADSQQLAGGLDDNGLTLPQSINANADSVQEPGERKSDPIGQFISSQAEQLASTQGAESSIKIALLLATLSLAPAIILMTTCYVRVVIVLTLLRQAFGAQQLPPTQVLTSLSLFLTLLVMAPVWSEVKTQAIDPYASSAESFDWQASWKAGVIPVKDFMCRQIRAAGNEESVALFYNYIPKDQPRPKKIEEVPLNVLLPAFMISELKVAFLLGFQIYLPFLVLDLVVSTVTVSMGMLMLPPTVVSFPLKLILFVMVDGWNLVVGMLLSSFGPPPL